MKLFVVEMPDGSYGLSWFIVVRVDSLNEESVLAALRKWNNTSRKDLGNAPNLCGTELVFDDKGLSQILALHR